MSLFSCRNGSRAVACPPSELLKGLARALSLLPVHHEDNLPVKDAEVSLTDSVVPKQPPEYQS